MHDCDSRAGPLMRDEGSAGTPPTFCEYFLVLSEPKFRSDVHTRPVCNLASEVQRALCPTPWHPPPPPSSLDNHHHYRRHLFRSAEANRVVRRSPVTGGKYADHRRNCGWQRAAQAESAGQASAISDNEPYTCSVSAT